MSQGVSIETRTAAVISLDGEYSHLDLGTLFVTCIVVVRPDVL